MREAQKHVDQYSDPDPEDWFLRCYPFSSKLASYYCCESAPIRIRIRPSIIMPIQTRALPQVLHMLEKSEQKFNLFFLTGASLLHIAFFSRQLHRCQNYLFWTVYWNFMKKTIVYLYFWLKSVLRIRDIWYGSGFILLTNPDADPGGPKHTDREPIRIQIGQNNKHWGSDRIHNAVSHPGLDLDKPPSVKE